MGGMTTSLNGRPRQPLSSEDFGVEALNNTLWPSISWDKLAISYTTKPFSLKGVL